MKDVYMAEYTPETWQELAAHPEAKIDKTYAEYLRTCERMIAEFKARGVRVVRQPINVAQMIEWCHKHGYEIDSAGRARFGAALELAQGAGLDVMTMPLRDTTRKEH
jgi:hypothetical protein